MCTASERRFQVSCPPPAFHLSARDVLIRMHTDPVGRYLLRWKLEGQTSYQYILNMFRLATKGQTPPLTGSIDVALHEKATAQEQLLAMLQASNASSKLGPSKELFIPHLRDAGRAIAYMDGQVQGGAADRGELERSSARVTITRFVFGVARESGQSAEREEGIH